MRARPGALCRCALAACTVGAAAAALVWPTPAGAQSKSGSTNTGGAPAPGSEPRPPAAGLRTLPVKGRQDFWSWLTDPSQAEVKLILRKVAENRTRAASTDVLAYDYGAQFSPARAELRAELLADSEAMLRYALALAPHNVDVERELAIVLDENDRPQAQALLERYLADEAAERVSADARVRLGRLYARQRRFGDAMSQLRLALGGKPDYRTRTQAVLLLSSILMHTGRLSEAIDLLRGHVASAGFGYYGGEALSLFALAVAYDRDEQISQAHEVLTRIVNQGNGNGSDQLMNVLHDSNLPPNRHPLVPPVERHYFAALQYEALGFLPEARAEWQAYAADDDAPYRQRADQHIAELDRLLRAERAASRARPQARPAPAPVRATAGAPP